LPTKPIDRRPTSIWLIGVSILALGACAALVSTVIFASGPTLGTYHSPKVTGVAWVGDDVNQTVRVYFALPTSGKVPSSVHCAVAVKGLGHRGFTISGIIPSTMNYESATIVEPDTPINQHMYVESDASVTC
jgi:hypothetical protein